ncbi:ATP-binding cassette transporter [Cryptosporidium bovis]|uniref:ATP-binding cassette transporter n=1 Tax=Cryptosporidium bovis TaxID=310047 RepID=UPI00351A2E0C|nr:ATP-binding cassette transporter [Cryptosporidium bovis]
MFKKVGEGGVELSIGQKQRINLARAFLKKSPILILDEPTSALDIKNEKLIMESVETYLKEMKSTVILITHRLNTVTKCDRIIMLSDDYDNNGSKVVEEGSHEEVSLISYKSIIANKIHFSYCLSVDN